MSTITKDIYHARQKLKELEEYRMDLKNRYQLLDNRIKEIQASILEKGESSDLNILINKCQKERGETSRAQQLLKDEIRRWKASAETSEKNLLDFVRTNGEIAIGDLPSILIMKDVETMRQKYSDFASDSTRVSSMRLMASSFASELGDLLKKRSVVK